MVDVPYYAICWARYKQWLNGYKDPEGVKGGWDYLPRLRNLPGGMKYNQSWYRDLVAQVKVESDFIPVFEPKHIPANNDNYQNQLEHVRLLGAGIMAL